MNEQKIKESIKAITVQIITPKEQGTGVLIKYNNYLSILTVYHCVYGKKSKPHKIEADEVKFVFSNKAEYYAVAIEVVGELVILALDTKEFRLQLPQMVALAEVEYEADYYIRGFPSGLDKAHNFRAKCNDIERETFKIEIDNLTNDTSGEDAIEYMRGVSGSGVFFSRDKKLYLVGLVNALSNQSGTFNAVESLNLCKLLNKRTPQKKFYFNYLWLGLLLFFGVLALKSIKKETTRLKPLITNDKKRAFLHINKSEFSSIIESQIAKKFCLVRDEKLANYIIDINSKIQKKESMIYGENIVKIDCQLNLKVIELQSRDIIKSEFYRETATGFDEESSGSSCFHKLLESLNL